MPSATPHHQASHPGRHITEQAQRTPNGMRIWNSFAQATPQPPFRLQPSANSRGDAPDRAGTHPVPGGFAHHGGPRAPATGAGQYNPRVLAALAYALPLVPALLLLARERRNRFVRIHAAQALVFFCLVGLAQASVFAALVVVGSVISSARLAIVLGLVAYSLFALLGLAGFVTWLLLLADAMAGRRRKRLVLSGLADVLDRILTRRAPPTSASAGPRRNIPAE
jgi:uncharacterized membrane protein